MAFDGLVLNATIDELKKKLIGGKIDKVYQPSKNEIILGIYSSGINYALLVNIQPELARFHLTTHSKPNPFQALNFCMLLRKHLIGSRILEINTLDLERIVEIKVETYNELKDKVIKKIIIQIMASLSNVILTNENNVIIDSLKHISNLGLEIMPARVFEFPVTNKKSFISLSSFDEFYEIIKDSLSSPIYKVLSDNFIGISNSFIKGIISKKSISENPNIDEIRQIYDEIKNIINNISNVSLCVNEDIDDYTIFLNDNKKDIEVNFFLDDYYFNKEQKSTYEQKRNSLLAKISSQLKKYTKRLENINSKLNECQDMDKYRIYGELLTSNLYKYTSQGNLDSVTVENYYDNQKEITIPLDKKYSVSKNAERFFKKYNKLKNTLRIVGLQKKETEIELEYIQSLLYSIEDSTDINSLNEIEDEILESNIFGSLQKANKSDLKKKKKNDDKIYPTELKIENFTVYVGKNNKQNDLLTFKIANKQDIWFHVQKAQGSHVVLRTDNKPVPDKVLLECAKIAAAHSKAKGSYHVPVDYCPVKNVKKPSGAKPGMVIYNDYKTIIV